MRWKKIIPLLLIFIITITALMKDLHSDITVRTDRISINQAQNFNKGWMYENRELTLPIHINAPENEEIKIYRYLPPYIDNNKYLCIISSQQSIRVYINKDMIYGYGYDENDNPKELPGNLYNIIKIPTNAAGRKITITYKARKQKQSGEINAILYGYKGDIILSIIKGALYEIVALTLLGIISLVCLLISFINRKKLKTKALFYNALLLLTIALWVFLQSSLPQFVLNSQHNVKIMSYFCTMIAPIFANKFLKCMMKNRYDTICRYFVDAYLAVFVFNALAMIILGNAIEKCLVLTHIIICINTAVVIYTLFKNLCMSHSRQDKLLTICIMPFLISALCCIITCYTSDFVFTIARSVIIGIAFSIIFIVAVLIIYLFNLYKDAMYTKVLNTLAFQDTITGGKNRTAFYQDIDNTIKNNRHNESICIMILDVNNLKIINDTYGHLIGDEAIKKCYECISKCIPKRGTCYRIGGDEFACIFIGCSREEISSFTTKFTKLVSDKNKSLKYDFSAAFGYSFYIQNIDENLLDTFNRADKEMYKKKQDMKNAIKN